MIRNIFSNIIIIISIMAVLFVASMKLIDGNKIYQEFMSNAEIDLSNAKVGDVTISPFPYPSVVLNKIELSENIAAKNLKFYLSVKSLYKFSPSVSSLDIEELIFIIQEQDSNISDYEKLIVKYFSKSNLTMDVNIQKLTLVDSNNIPIVTIHNFKLNEFNGELNFTGKFENFAQINGSAKNVNNDLSLMVELSDDNYSFTVNELFSDNKLKNGSLALKELSNNPNNNLSQKQKEAKIQFDVSDDENYKILNNISIILDKAIGAGEVKLGKNNDNISSIRIAISDADLSGWNYFSKDQGSENIVLYILDKLNMLFDFKKYPFNANIVIKDIKFDDKNTINDVNILCKTENDELHIYEFEGAANDNGYFKLNGVISQNSFRSLFKGKISLKHTDITGLVKYLGYDYAANNDLVPFTLSSGITLSSVDLSLHNLVLEAEDSKLSGDISIKYIGNMPRINTNLNISSINLDKTNIAPVAELNNYIKGFFVGIKDDAYLNKFIPIRKLNSLSNHVFKIENMILGGDQYHNISCDLKLSPGQISFNKLIFHKKEDWLDSSMNVDVTTIKPQISITINDGVSGVDFISASKIMDIRNKIVDNIDFNKISVDFDVSMKKVHQSDFIIEDLIFKAASDKKILKISKLSANLLGGKIYSVGNVVFDPYSLNFVYTANNLHIDEIAKLLPENMIKSGGYLSASGSWSTKGDKIKEQLYNLYMKSDIAAKDISISNFSIDDLIQKIRSDSYITSNFQNDLAKSMLTGETIIKDFKSNIELKKGIIQLNDTKFLTEKSSGVVTSAVNLYDFTINGAAKIYFDIARIKNDSETNERVPNYIGVDISGNLFAPKKLPDTKQLEESLQKHQSESLPY